MNYILYNNDIPAAKIDMETRLTGPVIKNVRVLDYGNLPYEIRKYINVQASPENAIALWLKNRSIPDARQNLDWFLYNYFGVEQQQFGRMSLYKHIPAVLSYYSSGFDGYTVVPQKDEYLLFAEEEPLLNHLYELKAKKPMPFSRDTEEGVIQAINSWANFTNNINLISSSYTIPSIFPSWWRNGKLQQAVSEKIADDVIKTAQNLSLPEPEYVDGILTINNISKENIRFKDNSYNTAHVNLGLNEKGEVKVIMV